MLYCIAHIYCWPLKLLQQGEMLKIKWYLVDKYIMLEITIRFSRNLKADPEKSTLTTTTSSAAIIAVIQQSTESHRRWIACTSTASCKCNFNKVPQFIDSNDWRTVTRHSLSNHWPDVFYWREIWRTCRPRQQPNIFCIKEDSNNISNTCSGIILLKRRIS